MLWGGPQAPVAQLDRVSVFETEGWRFEPVRARHGFILLFQCLTFRWIEFKPVSLGSSASPNACPRISGAVGQFHGKSRVSARASQAAVAIAPARPGCFDRCWA